VEAGEKEVKWKGGLKRIEKTKAVRAVRTAFVAGKFYAAA
jgi:hypothetical protein